jgi:hypothetical protein
MPSDTTVAGEMAGLAPAGAETEAETEAEAEEEPAIAAEEAEEVEEPAGGVGIGGFWGWVSGWLCCLA